VDVRLCQVPESRSPFSPNNFPGDFPPHASHPNQPPQPQPPQPSLPPPVPIGMFNGIPGFPLPDAPAGGPPLGYTQEGGILPVGMFPEGGAPLGAGGAVGFPPSFPGGGARGGAEGGGFLGGMGGNISVEDLFRMIGKVCLADHSSVEMLVEWYNSVSFGVGKSLV